MKTISGMTREIKGEIIHGKQIGRTLGFPTANIRISYDNDATNGVYAALVRIGDTFYRAMLNIGTRPTIGHGTERFAEAHLFGFSGDIYGQTVTVSLLSYIRPERRFPDIESLRNQLEIDRKAILAYFATNNGIPTV